MKLTRSMLSRLVQNLRPPTLRVMMCPVGGILAFARLARSASTIASLSVQVHVNRGPPAGCDLLLSPLKR